MYRPLTLRRAVTLVVGSALWFQSPAQAGQTTIELPRNTRLPLPAEVSAVALLAGTGGLCEQGKTWQHDADKRELWTENCAGRFELSTAPAESPESGAGDLVGAVLALAAIAGVVALISRNDKEADEYDRHRDRPERPRPPPPHNGYYPDTRPSGHVGRGQIRGPNGLCLGLRNRSNGVAQGAEAVLERCDGRSDQRFQWTERGELRMAGYCLDAAGGGTHNGTKLIAWRCSNGRNQKWFVDGSRIRGEQSGKCLDVQGNRLQPGTPVILYQCHNGPNQRWAY